MKNYIYENCIISKIVDGDTIHLNIDLGFDVWRKLILRLAYINAPELKGKTYQQGLESKNFLSELLPIGTVVKFKCVGKDKYGRWIGEIYKEDKLINQIMLDNNKAERYE